MWMKNFVACRRVKLKTSTGNTPASCGTLDYETIYIQNVQCEIPPTNLIK